MTLVCCDCNMFSMKKVLKFLAFSSLFVYVFVLDANAYVDKNNAVIRIMNKAAGKAQTVTLPVEKEAEFEKLSLLVRTCKQNDPFQAENFFAFIEISKDSEGKIFSGWMNANEPGENPVQNADYDVWLVKCE